MHNYMQVTLNQTLILTLTILRVYSHQESPLVHFGPDQIQCYFFLVWCGSLSHWPFSESESESALFAKCAQTHKEFVVVFKKLLVHTRIHAYLTWEQKHLKRLNNK